MKKYLTIPEACRSLRISRGGLYWLLRGERIAPHHMIPDNGPAKGKAIRLIPREAMPRLRAARRA